MEHRPKQHAPTSPISVRSSVKRGHKKCCPTQSPKERVKGHVIATFARPVAIAVKIWGSQFVILDHIPIMTSLSFAEVAQLLVVVHFSLWKLRFFDRVVDHHLTGQAIIPAGPGLLPIPLVRQVRALWWWCGQPYCEESRTTGGEVEVANVRRMQGNQHFEHPTRFPNDVRHQRSPRGHAVWLFHFFM